MDGIGFQLCSELLAQPDWQSVRRLIEDPVGHGDAIADWRERKGSRLGLSRQHSELSFGPSPHAPTQAQNH